MPDEKANARNRRKRERDRAADIVRIEERLPRSMVEQLKEFAANLRKKAEQQNEGEAS